MNPPTLATLGGRERRLFTVDEFYRMMFSRILSEDSSTELVDGTIYLRWPISPWHASRTEAVCAALYRCLDPSVYLSNQSPVSLDRYNEPIADAVLLPAGFDRELSGHPGPAEILVLIEIADRTVDFDLGPKAALYARSGIRDYWVISYYDDAVFVHRKPRIGAYQESGRHVRGEQLAPIALPGVRIDVGDLLGTHLSHTGL